MSSDLVVMEREQGQYRSEYHYPRGATIPFEEVVLLEQAYTNLDDPATCPKCGSSATRELASNWGPVRTIVHYWRVDACVYSCDSCQHGYVAIKVVD